MGKFTELLTSRKFWAALVVAVFDVLAWIRGEIGADVAIAALVAVVGLWSAAQSRVDAAKVKANGG